MTVNITDDFTGSAGVAITAHSTDTGQAYVRPPGGASGAYTLDGLGGVTDGNAGLGAFAVVDVVLDSNAYRPEVYMNAANQMVIYQSVKAAATATMYICLFHGGVGEFIAYRYTAGTPTEIFRTSGATSPASSPGLYGLQRSGAVLQLTRNGTVIGSATDPAPLTDPGTGGFSGSGMTSFQITGSASIVGAVTPPVITSNGGGSTASISVAENTTAITTVTFTPGSAGGTVLSISGGPDNGDVSINPSTGEVTFTPYPDYEAPADADANNTYIFTVTATEGSLHDDQTITVTVTNDTGETPPVDPPRVWFLG